MNRLNLSIFNVIKERDGMLMRQLYETLPENDRVSYSYFRAWVEKSRTSAGVLRRRPFSRSNSVFLTANRHISDRRMRLMIMITEWEILSKKTASWYCPADRLHSVYGKFKALVPKDPQSDWESEQNRRRLIWDLKWKEHWTKQMIENKNKRLEIYRKMSPKIREMKGSTEEVQESISKIYKSKSKEVSIVTPLTFTHGSNKFTYSEAPEDSIHSLWARGIFPAFYKNQTTLEPSSVVWHFFDIENNITQDRFNHAIADIFDFMIINDWNGLDFMIYIYTWNESRSKIYANMHKVEHAVLKIKNKKGLGKLRTERIDSGRFKGVQFINLNVAKYFNTFKSNQRKDR